MVSTIHRVCIPAITKPNKPKPEPLNPKPKALHSGPNQAEIPKPSIRAPTNPKRIIEVTKAAGVPVTTPFEYC